jgi:hypothetical protein
LCVTRKCLLMKSLSMSSRYCAVTRSLALIAASLSLFLCIHAVKASTEI